MTLFNALVISLSVIKLLFLSAPLKFSFNASPQLVEPVLAMVPMTMSLRNEGRDNRLIPIVNMYAAIIKRGLMDIENIPESIREEVEKLI